MSASWLRHGDWRVLVCECSSNRLFEVFDVWNIYAAGHDFPRRRRNDRLGPAVPEPQIGAIRHALPFGGLTIGPYRLEEFIG
jgi:hypothetical protein